MSQLSEKRGSAILAVLVYCIILSVGVASFLKLVNQERKMVALSEANYSLMNLAESGLEESVWALNNQNWSDWIQLDNGQDYYRPPVEVELSNGYSGYFRVLVQSYNKEPVVYSEAVTVIPGGKELKKQVRISVAIGGGSAGGLIAKGDMDLGGQPGFDSYDSSLGPPDPFLNRSDKITVGTVSESSNALKLSGQVDIYGYAGTGRRNPNVSGPHNKIKGFDSPPGNIDWNRVARDFTFDFPDVTEPSWSGADTSLPSKVGNVITIGDPLIPKKYYVDKLNISGQTVVKIVGDVQIHIKDGMSVSGQAFIQVENDSRVEIYSPKDFSISGQGFVNKTSKPENLKIFGTVKRAGDQTFSLSGQGLVEAVFYMPNAKANISGQGDVAGSLIAHEVHYSGQGKFHYDLSLDGTSDPKIEGITSWHELSKVYQLDFDHYIEGDYYY